MYILLIAIDRASKIATIPLVVFLTSGTETTLLLCQSVVLLCYALLSAGRDAVFTKRIFSNHKYFEIALSYRLRTLGILSPIICLYLYIANPVEWFYYFIICIVTLFGGCFDIYESVLQAHGNHKRYLFKKIGITTCCSLVAYRWEPDLLMVAPYLYPILLAFKQKYIIRINKILNLLKIYRGHFSKYFYAALLNLSASKYELVLGVLDGGTQNMIKNVALANRFADMISFAFSIVIIKNLKKINSESRDTRKKINRLMLAMLFFGVACFLTIFVTIERELGVTQKILLGITLGICYGSGGIISYIWASLNLPMVALKIGFLNAAMLLCISVPLYFTSGFNAFILNIAATQLALTFIPYLRFRKSWLS